MPDRREMSVLSERIRDRPDMIYVSTNRFGVTASRHDYPILKTHGLGQCAALCLRDPNTTLSVLMHLSPTKKTDVLSLGIDNAFRIMLNHGFQPESIPQVEAQIVSTVVNQNFAAVILDTVGQRNLNLLGHYITQSGAIAFDADSGGVFELENYSPWYIGYDELDTDHLVRARAALKSGATLTSDSKSLS